MHFTWRSLDIHFKIVKERNNNNKMGKSPRIELYYKIMKHGSAPIVTLTVERLWGHGCLVHSACWSLMFGVTICHPEPGCHTALWSKRKQSITLSLWRSRK